MLSVSRSGYYEWLARLDSPRAQENALLLKHIKTIHAESRGTYGSPRIHAELTLGLGLPVNVKRVARLMSEYRPEPSIIALTTSEVTYRRLALVWGVTPVLIQPAVSTDELIDNVEHVLRSRNLRLTLAASN